MTEASYPHPVSISDEAIAKLQVVDDLTLEPSTVEDMRPTQAYKDAVQEVIEARQRQPHTQKKVPLTEAIDTHLARRDITR